VDSIKASSSPIFGHMSVASDTQAANFFLFRDNHYTGNVNLTYIRGQHGLRFGGEHIHASINRF
jgi:hypothetical protein